MLLEVNEMNSLLPIKLAVSFVTGFLFWFFVLLIMTAYAFMPGKEAHSVVFMAVVPVLYLVGTTLFFNKLFKNHGWKESLINFGLILCMAGLSLVILDTISKIM
ncbi:MAG: hypothetical protein Kow00111_28530 [Thermincola ferriacetica]